MIWGYNMVLLYIYTVHIRNIVGFRSSHIFCVVFVFFQKMGHIPTIFLKSGNMMVTIGVWVPGFQSNMWGFSSEQTVWCRVKPMFFLCLCKHGDMNRHRWKLEVHPLNMFDGHDQTYLLLLIHFGFQIVWLHTQLMIHTSQVEPQ
jgi:hypothetical protein